MGLRSSGCRWWSLEVAGGTTAIVDLLRPWYMKKVGCFVYDDEKHIYELKVHKESGFREKYYDAKDNERFIIVEVTAPEVVVPAPTDQTSDLQKEKTSSGVDPSRPSGSIPDSDFQKLQAELDHAREENARLQALLQEATPQKAKP
ncbi:hypothetical protein Dimus_018710 [Dionaea muscipula]